TGLALKRGRDNIGEAIAGLQLAGGDRLWVSARLLLLYCCCNAYQDRRTHVHSAASLVGRWASAPCSGGCRCDGRRRARGLQPLQERLRPSAAPESRRGATRREAGDALSRIDRQY